MGQTAWRSTFMFIQSKLFHFEMKFFSDKNGKLKCHTCEDRALTCQSHPYPSSLLSLSAVVARLTETCFADGQGKSFLETGSKLSLSLLSLICRSPSRFMLLLPWLHFSSSRFFFSVCANKWERFCVVVLFITLHRTIFKKGHKICLLAWGVKKNLVSCYKSGKCLISTSFHLLFL